MDAIYWDVPRILAAGFHNDNPGDDVMAESHTLRTTQSKSLKEYHCGPETYLHDIKRDDWWIGDPGTGLSFGFLCTPPGVCKEEISETLGELEFPVNTLIHFAHKPSNDSTLLCEEQLVDAPKVPLPRGSVGIIDLERVRRLQNKTYCVLSSIGCRSRTMKASYTQTIWDSKQAVPADNREAA